jgi:hypothetical protein
MPMKKIIFTTMTAVFLTALSLFAVSCHQAKKQSAEQPSVETTGNRTAAEQVPDKEKSSRKVKHYFLSTYEDGSHRRLVFFDDGTVFECLGKEACNKDKNIENLVPNKIYKETSKELMISGGGDNEDYNVDFYDDEGRITKDWKIINYHKIISPYQLIDFQPYNDKIKKKDILEIKETCLIFPLKEEKDFQGDEIEAFADWGFYASDKIQRLGEIGNNYIVAEKRYISFTLADGEKMIVDIKKFGEDNFWEALFYFKGYIPFRLDVLDFEDNREKEIEMTLRKLKR